jgi:gluconokinase
MGSPIVVMGVSGSGKSTVGAALAQRLRVPFADADDFHPPANIEKMTAGHPLNDDDRYPWLEAVGDWLAGRCVDGGVIAARRSSAGTATNCVATVPTSSSFTSPARPT